MYSLIKLFVLFRSRLLDCCNYNILYYYYDTCVSVAESVQYPWERTLTSPNKVPYYVKYEYVLQLMHNL